MDTPTPVVWHRWAFAATALAIIVALLLIGLWGGGSTQQKTESATTVPVSSTSGPSPVKLWVQEYGSEFQTLLTDINGVDTATQSVDVQNGNYTPVLYACQVLLSDVQAAANNPPIPQGNDQDDLGTALGLLQAASENCINGVNYNSTADIVEATTQFTQAGTSFSALSHDIKVSA